MCVRGKEVGEIFRLFKDFVHTHRPCLDIDSVATGETWFGEDALERKLCDRLQTFDDVLLSLHTDGVEVYSLSYQPPSENPFERLGLRQASARSSRGGRFPVGGRGSLPWAARVLLAALNLPTEPGRLGALIARADDHLDLDLPATSRLQGAAAMPPSRTRLQHEGYAPSHHFLG